MAVSFNLKTGFPPLGFAKNQDVRKVMLELQNMIADIDQRVQSFTGLSTGTLEATGNFTNTNRLLTDSNGNVFMPNQQKFTATFQPSGEVPYTHTGEINPVIFETEVTDVGGNYNNSTGIFTAEVTAKYFLSAFFPVAYGGGNPSTSIELSIVTTGETIQGSIFTLSAGGGTIALLGVGIVPMTANDTAFVRVRPTGSTTTFLQPISILYNGLGTGSVRKAVFTGICMG